MQTYITDSEKRNYTFPPDWKQSFYHTFIASRPVNETVVIRNYINTNSKNREVGFEILIFLYERTFATKEQLKRLLMTKGFDTEMINTALDDVLSEYTALFFLNYFTLSAYVLDELPEDSFRIYCLDYSARFILDHYYRDGIATLWRSTNSLRSAETVSKYLMSTEFCLLLMASQLKTLRYYQSPTTFMMRKKEMYLSARFSIEKNNLSKEYLLEVIRAGDLPLHWQGKVNEQLAPFMTEPIRVNGNDMCWSRYFDYVPALILLVETMEQAIEAAKIYYKGTGKMNFRVTTDDELLNRANKMMLYKFEPEKGIVLPDVKQGQSFV